MSAADVSDATLARQAQQGDQAAFMTLYERYFPKVYNRVRSKVPPHQVDDVTQEIFIAVLRSLDGFELRARFSTWLYTIVNRQIADFYRTRSRKAHAQSVSLDKLENVLSASTYASEHAEELALTQKALLDLPEHYQEVILLRFADGLTFAEIAEHQGQSLEAAKSLYRRAVQALRDKVGVTA